MRFCDLDPDRKHQMMVNLEAFKIACALLSDPNGFQELLLINGGNLSAEGWGAMLGEIAVDKVRALSERQKNRLFEELDQAVDTANQTGESFILVIEQL